MAVTLAILPPSWVPGKQSAIYTVDLFPNDISPCIFGRDAAALT